MIRYLKKIPDTHGRQHAVRYGTATLHAFLPFYKHAVSTETGLHLNLIFHRFKDISLIIVHIKLFKKLNVFFMK
jgi:hypothetical protein